MKKLKLMLDGLIKSRHTREGWYQETLQLLEKIGFSIKDFGNDSVQYLLEGYGFKRNFLREHQYFTGVNLYSCLVLIAKRISALD